jgi:hypothetical protein
MKNKRQVELAIMIIGLATSIISLIAALLALLAGG